MKTLQIKQIKLVRSTLFVATLLLAGLSGALNYALLVSGSFDSHLLPLMNGFFMGAVFYFGQVIGNSNYIIRTEESKQANLQVEQELQQTETDSLIVSSF